MDALVLKQSREDVASIDTQNNGPIANPIPIFLQAIRDGCFQHADGKYSKNGYHVFMGPSDVPGPASSCQAVRAEPYMGLAEPGFACGLWGLKARLQEKVSRAEPSSRGFKLVSKYSPQVRHCSG